RDFHVTGVQTCALPICTLAGTVASYRDGDYGFSLSPIGHGELGELVGAHNRLGDTLREQRQALVQRELLLDTMVQNTPVAMLLRSEERRVGKERRTRGG